MTQTSRFIRADTLSGLGDPRADRGFTELISPLLLPAPLLLRLRSSSVIHYASSIVEKELACEDEVLGRDDTRDGGRFDSEKCGDARYLTGYEGDDDDDGGGSSGSDDTTMGW